MANELPMNAAQMPMGGPPPSPMATVDEDTPDFLPDDDITVDVSSVLHEEIKNYADNEAIVKELKSHLSTIWSGIYDRSSYEEVWDKTDEMYRVKASGDIKEKNRANFGCGVFTRAINQLTGMAYQVFMENKHSYKFIPRPSMTSGGMLDRAKMNSKILTDLLYIAMGQPNFKQNFRKILHSIYKYGNQISAIPFRKETKDWKIKGKKTPVSYAMPVLPIIEHVPIENVWVDANLDGLDLQQAIFIKDLTTWSRLLADKTVILPKEKFEKGDMAEKKAVDGYTEQAGDQLNSVRDDRFANAGHDYNDKETNLINHWVIWAVIPIDTDKDKWDKATSWKTFRIRMLGDPQGKNEVIECRENMFPGGIPLLLTHQAEDDIGFYHISLAEKVETYHDQICTAQNQLADNRSKINRRPIFYNTMIITHMDRYDFGHSNMIGVDGDPSTGLYESQMLDITQTIMGTIAYNENKIKEVMNTTDAILGVAMGGRTSASEYQGARMAATTPIYADLSVIEESLMVGFMDKFAQFIHAFFSRADIIYFVGEEGRYFDFNVTGKDYSVVAEGVVYARDKAMKMQNLMMLLQTAQDAVTRSKILRRIGEAMELENVDDITAIPGVEQAEKAAFFENISILESGNIEAPHLGENHDVHIGIHRQALLKAKQEDNQYASLLGNHISETMNIKQQEQSPAGVGSLPAFGPQAGQSGGAAPAPDMNMPDMEQAGNPMPA